MRLVACVSDLEGKLREGAVSTNLVELVLRDTWMFGVWKAGAYVRRGVS